MEFLSHIYYLHPLHICYNKGKIKSLQQQSQDTVGAHIIFIIIYGLPKTGIRLETWEQCESAMRGMFKEKLKIDDNIIFDIRNSRN